MVLLLVKKGLVVSRLEPSLFASIRGFTLNKICCLPALMRHRNNRPDQPIGTNGTIGTNGARFGSV